MTPLLAALASCRAAAGRPAAEAYPSQTPRLKPKPDLVLATGPNRGGSARALGRTWDHGSLRPLAGESPERMRVSPPTPASQPVQRNRPRPADRDARPAPAHTDQAVIRNFCIIAHIDHGKSTLADRMLQFTGVVEGRQMRAQYLDRMDIKRGRGIIIESQAGRLPW